ncbi:hypothetical protein BABINDRAFT_172642 [Babjeviella inositovora NRRL Y-12698]|uniref:Protein-serine/threonine kinase n=1 Tax=Babjeviella inositovora NRRL Y-12698 TaxID=984486 RepID=A0A1E3QLC9_9ASCO|nr:uncharacterized protein BABINDRAFT_172642 [Babjeviella inositovora NRRL Y-12698]ODQ77892.1 hypothetical protein BABINDRAFT_172642 [Babjeviella inositovora NRRL Y-12698]
MLWKLSEPMKKEIYKYAKFPQTPVSLRQMVQFGPRPNPGSLFRASQFIVEELPIRLAHKVKDIENSPSNLRDFPSVLKVRDWYAQSFEELVSLPKPVIDDSLRKLIFNKGETDNLHHPAVNEEPPVESSEYIDDGMIVGRHHQSQHAPYADLLKKYYNAVPPESLNCQAWPQTVHDYNTAVTDTLKRIKKRHDATVATMAQGVLEWKLSRDPKLLVHLKIQNFLDRFYMSRIGIRMLIGQHVALNDLSRHSYNNEDYCGIICTNLNIRDVIEDGIDNALYICDEHYGLFSNQVKIEVHCLKDISFMYVPGHLIHMIFETLKNSLRATIEFHTKEQMANDPAITSIEDVKFPPIKVIVSEGYEDITIKISDEGGGIPRSEIPLVWQYLYTTVDETPSLSQEGQLNFKAPMAGFGYGLPISRLYSRYFGGDLKLISMEGYGTDVYLHLNRLNSSSEPLQ